MMNRKKKGMATRRRRWSEEGKKELKNEGKE